MTSLSIHFISIHIHLLSRLRPHNNPLLIRDFSNSLPSHLVLLHLGLLFQALHVSLLALNDPVLLGQLAVLLVDEVLLVEEVAV